MLNFICCLLFKHSLQQVHNNPTKEMFQEEEEEVGQEGAEDILEIQGETMTREK